MLQWRKKLSVENGYLRYFHGIVFGTRSLLLSRDSKDAMLTEKQITGLPVDQILLVVSEHAILHLYCYSRFFHKLLGVDAGSSKFDEPFSNAIKHKAMVNKDGTKMSKSKATTVTRSN